MSSQDARKSLHELEVGDFVALLDSNAQDLFSLGVVVRRTDGKAIQERQSRPALVVKFLLLDKKQDGYWTYSRKERERPLEVADFIGKVTEFDSNTYQLPSAQAETLSQIAKEKFVFEFQIQFAMYTSRKLDFCISCALDEPIFCKIEEHLSNNSKSKGVPWQAFHYGTEITKDTTPKSLGKMKACATTTIDCHARTLFLCCLVSPAKGDEHVQTLKSAVEVFVETVKNNSPGFAVHNNPLTIDCDKYFPQLGLGNAYQQSESYHARDKFEQNIRTAVSWRQTPLRNEAVIFYIGHGDEGTGDWVLMDGQFSLEDIYRCATQTDLIPVTIISHCCFSGKWTDIEAHLKLGFSRHNLRIIATSTKDQITQASMMQLHVWTSPAWSGEWDFRVLESFALDPNLPNITLSRPFVAPMMTGTKSASTLSHKELNWGNELRKQGFRVGGDLEGGRQMIELALERLSITTVLTRNSRGIIICAIREAKARSKQSILNEAEDFFAHKIDSSHRRFPKPKLERLTAVLSEVIEHPPIEQPIVPILTKPETTTATMETTSTNSADHIVNTLRAANVNYFQIYLLENSSHVYVVPNDEEKAKLALKDLDGQFEIMANLEEGEIVLEAHQHQPFALARVDGTIGGFLVMENCHFGLTAKHCILKPKPTRVRCKETMDAAVIQLGHSGECHRGSSSSRVKCLCDWNCGSHNFEAHVPPINLCFVTNIDTNMNALVVQFRCPETALEETEKSLTVRIESGNRVFKLGNKTGFTAGRFDTFCSCFATDEDTYTRVCLVNPDESGVFSKHGDSGSLYFVQHIAENKIYFVPFALHVAAHQQTRQAIGLLLVDVLQHFWGDDADALDFCRR